MALALAYPEGVTRDELERQFALFAHIHAQNERPDIAAVRRRLAKEAAEG